MKIFIEQFFCAFLPPFLNIFCSVRSLLFLSFFCAHLCMKYSFGISNFLEEISSLSHSVVFLYISALITEEGFLISPCYSLETLHSNGCIFPFLLCLSLLFDSQLFVKSSSDTHLAFCISFPWMVLIPASCTMSRTPSTVLQASVYHIWSLESACHCHSIILRDLVWVIPEGSSGSPHFQFKSEFCCKEMILSKA